MPLQRVPLSVDDNQPLPHDVRRFIAEAEEHIDRLVRGWTTDPMPGFINSDFDTAWRTLDAVRENLRPGDAFCEWGCGLGVVAALASMAGFDAYGIEIESRLVDAGLEFLDDQEIAVELVVGSFLPHGSTETDDLTGDGDLGMRDGGIPGYEEMGMAIDDFDVIYIFPWPGEERAATRLFDRHAAVGALLIVNHGMDGMSVYRKV